MANPVSCSWDIHNNKNRLSVFKYIYIYAFIQSDLHCIQAIHFFCQYVCSLGTEPTTFALLMQLVAHGIIISLCNETCFDDSPKSLSVHSNVIKKKYLFFFRNSLLNLTALWQLYIFYKSQMDIDR